MGETGGFLQVSGITFTVDTSVESSVVLDDNGMFDSCGDALKLFVDNILTLDEGMPDYQVILDYITKELGGAVDSTYASPQGRIRIE